MSQEDNEEKEGLLGVESQGYKKSLSGRWWLLMGIYATVLFLSNLSTYIIATGASGPDFKRHGLDTPGPPSSRRLYKEIDQNSTHLVKFSPFSIKASFSEYTSPPSEKVEDAWRALGVEYNTFLVPIDEGPKFGISKDHVVVPSNAPGANGRSGYAVDMEAMHQLHCLNLVRKGLFFNHPHYSSPEHLHEASSMAFRDPPANVKGHLNHCIDALRERIMCTADTEVLPYYWRTKSGLTISDFAVDRQCKNFESVRDFARKHQIENWHDYRLTTPEGAYLASDLLSSE